MSAKQASRESVVRRLRPGSSGRGGSPKGGDRRSLRPNDWELATSVWALAKLGCRPPEEFWRRALSLSRRRLLCMHMRPSAQVGRNLTLVARW